MVAVHRLINDIDLVCYDDLNRSTIDYTYCHPDLGHKSFIDQIFIIACHKEAVCSLLVDEGACNSSFHNAICATICIADGLYIDNDVNLLVNESDNMSHRKYLKWDDNMRRKYYTQSGLLFNELELMNLPCLSRCGVCYDENHKVEVSALCKRIVACLQQARDDLYPCTDNVNRVGCDFRWDQGLSKLKEQSRDIHNLRKQIGRLRTSLINAERLRIKCLYKRDIVE